LGKKGTVLKFSSGEFLGGRDGLELLQDKAFEKLGEKWGVERGEKGSVDIHTNLAGWQIKLNNKEKELNEREKEINEREEEIEREKKQVRGEAGFLKNAVNSINETRKNLSGKDRIAESVFSILNAENVRGEERTKFYKIFYVEIPAFIKSIIQRIRKIPEHNNIQQTIKQTTENIKDVNNSRH